MSEAGLRCFLRMAAVFAALALVHRGITVCPQAAATERGSVETRAGGSRAELASDWHHPLYLDGGGYWRARVPVHVRNGLGRDVAGEPLALTVGRKDGQIAIDGQAAQAVRVCNAAGVEMLFNLIGPDGRPLSEGPIPAGSTLTIPVECPAGGEATYWVYFDNPKAWTVPDFLQASVGVRNGGVEYGEAGTPFGWKHDRGDADHRTAWVTEHPHSGRYCLKTIVSEGAEPTWIATRQRGIHIVGGAQYVMRAWVKAENVKGYAGWYIHVGNRETPMMISPMLPAGDGTFDWKQIEATFTAPKNANRADLGTVLRGTGTAWFDDVTLECLGQQRLSAQAGRPERLELRELRAPTRWLTTSSGISAWDYRVPVRVLNLSETPTRRTLVRVSLASLKAKLRGRLDGRPLRVVGPAGPVRHYRLDDTLLFETDVPARSAVTFYVYGASRGRVRSAAGSYAALLASRLNRVRDGSFEQPSTAARAWRNNTAGRRLPNVSVEVVQGGKFGRRCSRINVKQPKPEGWFGWIQDVPIEPGKTYLYAGWLRCQRVEDGTVQLHAHYRTADGQLCRDRKYSGAGPALSGTRDWTLLQGVLRTPDDAAILQLHLTVAASGTVWHDGIVLVPVTQGTLGTLEGRSPQRREALTIWPVNSIVKVFRDDLPPEPIPPAHIEVARNESEPLQLAVRSVRAIESITVEVKPPEDGAGHRLDQLEVAVVGYVPIDHPTSYYRSESPEWHRKFPTQPGRCDGWAGWWPDPLLPKRTFSLKPNQTQPLWITVHVPEDAAAGDYVGMIRLKAKGATLAFLPFVVHVWDFALPRKTDLPAIYDVRFGPRWRTTDETLEELYRKMWRFMAKYRLSPDRVWPSPKFDYKDGKASADFTEFDKAASYYFDELNLPHSYTPHLFYCFGWGHPPRKLFGEAPYEGQYPYEEADRSRLRPEYKRAYQACLKLFWDHVKERGWADRFVLYISDEPYYRLPHIRQQMKALCDMIHEVDPTIPIYSSTWHHRPEWDGYLDVWGIGHDGRVSVETMQKLRAAGDRLWFTTDGQMCTDTPYCAVERLLPHYCFHYGVDAYEFWGVSWLTYDPYRFGWHAYIPQSGRPGERFWVRYPNGDGFLCYPGAPIGWDGPVPSIRLAQAREGVEDYEYLHLLRTLIQKARAAEQDVSQAEAALKQANRLVSIPNAGGRYSTRILPDPDAVFRVRHAVAVAIEKLKH
ncbi:MAG: DUF4091 domain-containing protein [Planctomycetes bacterium]|nr:DUF4091 domain-containing protein [Planctomycetota bacterium]